jgi:hypothetical protein
MRKLFLSFLILSLTSCFENNSQQEKLAAHPKTSHSLPNQLSYYKCDYLQNKYDTVLSAGDEHEIGEVWGVNRNDINQLPIINNNDLDFNRIIKNAEAHLKKRFQDIDLSVTSLNIEKIDNSDSLNPKNSFIEVTFLYDKRGYVQKVPVLFDGRIVLSNKE